MPHPTRSGPPIPPDTMGCALCRRTVQRLATGEGRHTYTHAARPDHPPVAVPLHQILAPHLVCDHCNAPGPIWSYQAAPLQAITIGDHATSVQELGERFATCAPCAHHIESGNRRGLLQRMLAGFTRDAGEPADTLVLDTLTALRDAFWNTRRPGRDRLPAATPTAPPAIRATAVPKVRDRLATWWRDHTAPAGSAAAPPRHALADSLDRAVMLWIDPTFTDLARHAATSLPDLWIDPDQIPADDGLIIWAADPHLTPGIPDPVTAVAWTRVPHGWWITRYTATGASLTEPALQAVREQIGWLYPHGPGILLPAVPTPTTGEEPDPTLALVVATWALAGQPLAAVTTEPADRAIRRAYARTGRADPQIRIVRLRARSNAPDGHDRPHPTTRVYDHQWWVSPFWRQQPYGKNRALRRPVYIDGHFAGPDDKPVRIKPTVQVLGSTRPTTRPTHTAARPEPTP